MENDTDGLMQCPTYVLVVPTSSMFRQSDSCPPVEVSPSGSLPDSPNLVHEGVRDGSGISPMTCSQPAGVSIASNSNKQKPCPTPRPLYQSLPVPLQGPPVALGNVHAMVTQSKEGVFKPKCG
ncbi:hypothetical protein GOBAR_AA21329 [Gossypium barbadense]|uniref:Uncharacterized protein n=1 Tax=Gossypium barbadense TaxID=3634 RepID=A0A2P5X7N2_GOSBA|nr:hypothetical protein GOBAR_AA21329 [Gossypium barbadense]